MPEHVSKDTCAAYRAGMEDKLKEHEADVQRLYNATSDIKGSVAKIDNGISKKFIGIMVSTLLMLLALIANLVFK